VSGDIGKQPERLIHERNQRDQHDQHGDDVEK
jgi:hypothetical protein